MCGSWCNFCGWWLVWVLLLVGCVWQWCGGVGLFWCVVGVQVVGDVLQCVWVEYQYDGGYQCECVECEQCCVGYDVCEVYYFYDCDKDVEYEYFDYFLWLYELDCVQYEVQVGWYDVVLDWQQYVQQCGYFDEWEQYG